VDQKTRKAPLDGLKKLQPEVGLGGNSVGEDAAAGTGQNRLEQRIVDAGGHRAVKRHLIHEGQKGALHVGHVVVAVHVLAVEIGDHGEDGRELEEGAVALVGLGHQVLRRAQPGVRAQRVHAAAHDHRGIEPPAASTRPPWRWWWSCHACRRWRCRT
jgi:hypothetical protein